MYTYSTPSLIYFVKLFTHSKFCKIDPCTDGYHDCDHDQIFIVLNATFVCECFEGYQLGFGNASNNCEGNS